MVRNYVVIGVSAAGIGCLSKLRQLDPDAMITALSYEPEFPYNKCFLADYVGNGKSKEQLSTKPASFFADNRIDLRLGVAATAINRHQKTVTCDNGVVLPYDALLLAVGGSARVVPVEGADGVSGIFSFYTYAQTEELKRWIARKETETIIVVGAGLSGLECADALLGYNKKIIIIDRAPCPLPAHTTPASAQYIHNFIMAAGVQTIFSSGVQKVISSDGVIKGVVLVDGTYLDASMLIWAIGSQPNINLAQQAGLAVLHNAMVTNQFLQTSDPAIFAAGDCALVQNMLTGETIKSSTWPDAMMQGMVAASGMVGQERSYAGIVPWLSSAFFGKKFYAAGRLKPLPGDRVVEKNSDDIYTYVIVNAANVIQGFTLIGIAVPYAVDLKRSLMLQSVYQGSLVQE